MTDNTQPEAREFTMSQYASKDDMIGAMRKRIAELEAQLEAIGAGGVNGPLMTPAPTSGAADLPEALRIAAALEYCDANVAREAINELRRLHALTAQAISQPGGFDAGDMASAAAGGYRDGWTAAQAGAVPLTTSQYNIALGCATDIPPSRYEAVTRAIERAHGIKEGGQHG